MRIVVCVKHVPDIQAERAFTPEGRVDRGRGDGTVNEVDENALEAARRLAEAAPDGEVEVVALTMGPAPALDAVRRGLQLGADRGVHVTDDALAGSDAFATARVLAAAVRRIGDVDLVLLGMAALDSLTSLLPAALAEELDLPALTIASELSVEGGTARVRRDLDHVVEVLEADLPALVSVTDGINTPRFPNFQAIMAARGKPVETWSLADVGLAPPAVGDMAARTRVLEVTELVPREQEVHDTDDDGEAGTRLADFLVARGLA
ncbi:MAG: electron transfer flavoprotein subunit beta/FixA family protein [Actinomycetales bacterium]|nr:electron transfer flavoprotein subunit beta/FixA family protein [Actinomycetales bacterium]